MKTRVSDQLAREDRILKEIQIALSAIRTMDSNTRSCVGAVYASAPVTSGRRLYQAMAEYSITSPLEFRKAHPDLFKAIILKKNIRDGQRFGSSLEDRGWKRVIVPGTFFANGWTQEHYMTLWRQVIVRHAHTVALSTDWEWSLGCSEELLIAIQHGKDILQGFTSTTIDASLIRLKKAIDSIDKMGLDIKPHYEIWRQATLTVEALKDTA